MTADLEVQAISVRFGGVQAVDGVSLRAPENAITGLIGPNGAGKTTTFNAIAGVVRPQKGSASLGNVVLDKLSVAARAQRGLGRTFQRMELFDTMTVEENVVLGPELLFAGRRVWTYFMAGPSERHTARDRAAEAIELCGLASLSQKIVGGLSTGQRRLIELARTMAAPFRFLLLDEPSSGLDEAETENFGGILRKMLQERNLGILLVEHDMSLVRAVCDYTYVLEFGRLICEGPTARVMADDAVQAAYLGREGADHEVQVGS